MKTDKTFEWDPLSREVLAAAFEVSNAPGAGFLEKVYERALLLELKIRGIPASAQVSFPVRYKGCPVGTYVADLVVADSLTLQGNLFLFSSLRFFSRFFPMYSVVMSGYFRDEVWEVRRVCLRRRRFWMRRILRVSGWGST